VKAIDEKLRDVLKEINQQKEVLKQFKKDTQDGKSKIILPLTSDMKGLSEKY